MLTQQEKRELSDMFARFPLMQWKRLGGSKPTPESFDEYQASVNRSGIVRKKGVTEEEMRELYSRYTSAFESFK